MSSAAQPSPVLSSPVLCCAVRAEPVLLQGDRGLPDIMNVATAGRQCYDM
jgi:hypothetical protein